MINIYNKNYIDNNPYLKNNINNVNLNNKVENADVKDDKIDDKVGFGSDFIEIFQKDEDIINAKKSREAFEKTCSEFGSVDSYGSDMSAYYGVVLDQMEMQGIDIMPFFRGDTNFVDKVKEFAKNLNIENGYNVVPNNFSDFCDEYKNKLKQYGF